MKKLVILFFISGSFLNLYAENKLSIGGLWISETSKTGGAFELGITLLNANGLLLRNNISLKGCASTQIIETRFGELSIEDKFLFGGNIQNDNISIKPYGYVSTAAGIVNLKYFILDIGLGGGFELVFTKDASFFIEYGGAFSIPLSDNSATIYGGPSLTLGYRSYL